MKMKINKQAFDGDWFEYNEDVKLLIKPVGYFDLDIDYSNLDGGSVFKSMEKSTLMKSLVDWEGVETEDGEKLECNDENKELLLGQFVDIRLFISEKLNEIRDRIKGELKN